MIRPDKSKYPLSQKFNDPCCRKTYQNAFGFKGHNGLDIAIPCGKPLYASHTGKVYLYNDPNGYGLAVFITGGKYESVCAHMSKWSVKQGQSVKEGQLIGYSGTTGFSSGCHCHFGVRPLPYNRNNGFGGYVDPTPLIGGDVYKGKSAKQWYDAAKKRGDRFRELIKMYQTISPRKFKDADDWRNIKGVNESLVKGYKELASLRANAKGLKDKIINYIKSL